MLSGGLSADATINVGTLSDLPYWENGTPHEIFTNWYWLYRNGRQIYGRWSIDQTVYDLNDCPMPDTLTHKKVWLLLSHLRPESKKMIIDLFAKHGKKSDNSKGWAPQFIYTSLIVKMTVYLGSDMFG